MFLSQDLDQLKYDVGELKDLLGHMADGVGPSTEKTPGPAQSGMGIQLPGLLRLEGFFIKR